MILFYILVGIIYTLINAFVRKLNREGDWLLTLLWLFGWPLCFIALAIEKYQNKL